ncbi:Uncharacterized protein dnm_075390 [Desulfonema magnum]|uniref:Uncharacterized protein n=1 Tax=Desulfonema magnum TaxID=45655 RepID=A0A975BTQ8_9BACT|nr:Uncharacterized protein dnm_075390 [Desulfonema magnum]
MPDFLGKSSIFFKIFAKGFIKMFPYLFWTVPISDDFFESAYGV